MKAVIYLIEENASQDSFNRFMEELVVQKANFFVLNNQIYVLKDEQNKGLQALIEYADNDNFRLLDEVELLIDIKKVEQVFKV